MKQLTASDWFFVFLVSFVLTAILSGCRSQVPEDMSVNQMRINEENIIQALSEARDPSVTCTFVLEVTGKVRYGAGWSNLTAGPYPVVANVMQGDTMVQMTPVLFLPATDIKQDVVLENQRGFPDWPAMIEEAKRRVAAPDGYWFAQWVEGPFVRPLDRRDCVKQRP